MENIFDISLIQLLFAYFLIGLILFLIEKQKFAHNQEIIIACSRMTIQLVVAGYALTYIFEKQNPWLTLLVLGAMLLFAIHNISKRIKVPLTNLFKRYIFFSLCLGTMSTLFYLIRIVIHIEPWFDPRYVIPLAGMIIGNSMTGVILSLDILTKEMHEQKNRIEAALMLGAEPQTSCHFIMQHAFKASIIPTINSMFGMGIIFLPGMMTGQILSGTSPLTAIRYQLMIMLGILVSVSLTTILLLFLSRKIFFNSQKQLIN